MYAQLGNVQCLYVGDKGEAAYPNKGELQCHVIRGIHRIAECCKGGLLGTKRGEEMFQVVYELRHIETRGKKKQNGGHAGGKNGKRDCFTGAFLMAIKDPATVGG